MWQTVDYKGNTVKWYEAELIAENERKAYFAGREGTKTERKRDKRFSDYISRNCK